jgi:4-carboxymuconolactone decarboxylase
MQTSDETPRPLKVTDAARRHHDELFPNHASALAASDPELIEVFDNFAFDEVLAHTRLDTRTRLILTLAALIGSQAVNEYTVMTGAALTVGVTPVEIKEVLYQAVPYVGLARAYDFLHATNEVLRNRGVALPLGGQSTTTPATRYEKGLAVQKAIFGSIIDDLYASSPQDQLHIQEMLSANCFGDFLTRTGLPLAMRELVTLSFLVAMGGADSQVRGHIRGNLSVGHDRAVLLDVITQLLPWVGYPRTLNALACLNEIAPAAGATNR